MSKYLKAGAVCKQCGFERVEVTHATLREMIQTLKPAIHSIPVHILNKGRDSYAICPHCDVYALGIEMQQGFPFTDKFGATRTIQDLGDIWNG